MVTNGNMTTSSPPVQGTVDLTVLGSTSFIQLRDTSLVNIKILFQRALNTWADAPTELLEFSDKLEKL